MTDNRIAHITASYSVALLPFMEMLESKGIYSIKGKERAVFVSNQFFHSLFTEYTVEPMDDEAERHVSNYDGVRFYCVHLLDRSDKG